MSDPVATPVEIQDFMKKQGMNQGTAQRFLNEYLTLKQLAEEFDNPLIEHIRNQMETGLKQHGKAILEQHQPDPEWTVKCECGKPVNLHRAYFHVYNDVWKRISDVIKNWYKKNTAIKAGAKR